MTYILGLNAYHGDSAAALVRDGELVSAAEEERFRRIKHWAGFPSEAIASCLTAAGIGISEVDVVALNHDASANLWRKVAYAAKRRPELGLVLDRLRNKRERAGVGEQLRRVFGDAAANVDVVNIEHHIAHLASAFLVSPFEEAAVVSVDGFGDFASAAWGFGSGTDMQLREKIFFPDSLGIFYQAITQFLGFPHYGDEYKVMGLAPYGEPRFMREMRAIVRLEQNGAFSLNLQYFRHHSEKIEYEWENGEPRVGNIFTPQLEELLGPARLPSDELTERHRDIARSCQAMYEEAFFHLLQNVHTQHPTDNLALAGGCAMNSVANGKVYAHTPFKNVYVQSAAGDAGGAIGAAFAAWHRMSQADAAPKQRRFVMDHSYWGPSFSSAVIAHVLAERRADIEDAVCRVEQVADTSELCSRTAAAIAEGKVIGWFQGRMEWGPRALGNRSILADPRRSDVKEILNLKIKRRESFRPFAPSVLREHVGAWFETDADVPFMMQVFQVRPNKRSLVPAVTHVDGSGRLQTVTRDTNPRYYALIDAFRALTDVPMVLNTSFNENEPVVCTPTQALECFLRTRMDVLVLGDFMLSRGG